MEHVLAPPSLLDAQADRDRVKYLYIHTYIYLSLVRCRTSSVFSEKIFVYLFSGE